MTNTNVTLQHIRRSSTPLKALMLTFVMILLFFHFFHIDVKQINIAKPTQNTRFIARIFFHDVCYVRPVNEKKYTTITKKNKL